MADPPPEFGTIAEANAARANDLRSLRHPNRSEKVELTVRSAIQRFVAGTTTTDGAWTVTNLVSESGIPRPTLYRYEAVLRDFRTLADVVPRDKGGPREELRRLRTELRSERRHRIAERKRYEHVQAVLVQRIHALTLALEQASGHAKIVSLLKDNMLPEDS